MNLKTNIRAGKIRPNHNVTVQATAVSSFAATRFWSEIIATPGGQNSMRLLRGKENPMKLQTRVKAGRPGQNHNTIVR
jgi:hypothetical protein